MEFQLIGVAIIDDHPAVVQGVRRMLEQAADIAVVGSADGVKTGCELLEREDVDVALIDVKLADGFGITLIEQFAGASRPATLVFSSFGYPQYVAAALRAGARGFLLKTSTADEVETAIRGVAAGGTSFTASQLKEGQRPTVDLSDRERKIIALLAASRSNDEIAMELGLSRKTIEAALTRMFVRYSALSRTELAIRAATEGWLDT